MLTRLIALAIVLLTATPCLANEICENKDRKILGFREVEAIRSGPPPILLIEDETLTDQQDVHLSLTLDKAGNVTCLLVSFAPEPLIPQALSLARQWRFKPYMENGTPVDVAFSQRVDVNWRNPRPTLRVPFPDIRDWPSLRIRLEHSPGFMGCISYSVEIAGGGTLLYEGNYGAAGRVRQTERLDSTAIVNLVELFHKADFFWLHNTYTGDTQDFPDRRLSIAFDGHKKQVVDSVGREAGMPAEVTAIEEEIERLADTKRRTDRVKCRLSRGGVR